MKPSSCPGFGLSSRQDAPGSGVRRRDCADHRRWGLGGGCGARHPGRVAGARREGGPRGRVGAPLDALHRHAPRATSLGASGDGLGASRLERGRLRDRRGRAGGARPERRRPDDRARAAAVGRLADDQDREGRRALPARLAWPRARSQGTAGGRVHALERTDAEEPPAHLARRREGPYLDAPDHAGGVPEELRPAACRASAVRRRRARRRVVRLPRGGGHDRVVPEEEGLGRPRAGRGDRGLPGRAGLRRSQCKRRPARRLDRVDALLRLRGGACDARRAAPFRELGRSCSTGR